MIAGVLVTGTPAIILYTARLILFYQEVYSAAKPESGLSLRRGL